jgi:hypothetical protein
MGSRKFFLRTIATILWQQKMMELIFVSSLASHFCKKKIYLEADAVFLALKLTHIFFLAIIAKLFWDNAKIITLPSSYRATPCFICNLKKLQ